MYLPKKQLRKAAATAQRDYELNVAKEAQRQICLLEEFIKRFHPENLDEIYLQLSPAKRKLVTPIRLPDDEFIAQWQAKPYAELPFDEDAPEFFTRARDSVCVPSLKSLLQKR